MIGYMNNWTTYVKNAWAGFKTQSANAMYPRSVAAVKQDLAVGIEPTTPATVRVIPDTTTPQSDYTSKRTY